MTDEVDEVRSWLGRQGYALEHEVARTLGGEAFTARLGQSYLDPNTGAVRTVDVVGELAALPGEGPVKVCLVVECKHGTAPWIARVADVPPADMSWSPIASPLVAKYLETGRSLQEAFFPDGQAPPPAVSFEVIAKKPSNKGREDSYRALSQVISGARGLVGRSSAPVFMHPVVVLDGPLYSVRYGDDGTEHVRREKWSRVVWSGGDPDSVLVDVITRDALGAMVNPLYFSLRQVWERCTASGRPFRRQARVY